MPRIMKAIARNNHTEGIGIEFGRLQTIGNRKRDCQFRQLTPWLGI